jgi:hypothetical protein
MKYHNDTSRVREDRYGGIWLLHKSLISYIRNRGPNEGETGEATVSINFYSLLFTFMFSIQNIGDEPFAIAGCPLLQPGDTAEVSAEVYRMVEFNPNIKILSSDLK